ncbi:MAG TPA: tRNA preQ1(34) S-adenosylmethionine ribosyltransferase-isomerase QueA [Thermoanaerobaculia bacterium]|nr:tRNA preQ1(34) S-adenosylmethionine ribosyltransferase-isomerase QueA [Thermoanaerobaculia bacterium]
MVLISSTPVLTRDFDFELPASSIAQEPAPRGESRLLVLDREEGPERHRRVRDLPALLRRGDLLVLNDTRVIPARLFGNRVPGRPGTGELETPRAIGKGQGTPSAAGAQGQVELLLVERRSDLEWDALARPGRRARPGMRIEFATGLAAEVVGKHEDGRRRLRFSTPVEGHLDRLGHVPLPPYIRRPDELADRERYQTVFARRPGAIAAPTAGLHFSRPLLAEVAAAGIEIVEITLHVGIGTFKPVKVENVGLHRMDRERYEIPEESAAALRRARADGRRVVAVGTTVVRALEGAAAAAGGEPQPGPGTTDLFITPGFRFQVIDILLTNFHLPRSTLLMLVCAFAGRDRILAAYHEAIRAGYRFYSYGDAMLAERRTG